VICARMARKREAANLTPNNVTQAKAIRIHTNTDGLDPLAIVPAGRPQMGHARVPGWRPAPQELHFMLDR